MSWFMIDLIPRNVYVLLRFLYLLVLKRFLQIS
jgi:hypothetical protein